ncbi:1-acyl-sn-glycerol-3-phosphate acyltransferase [candidate division BRC1 bacterium HGW-BRC1-1]|jgi:1-acyl-sn-glycerol-3-phosphate acyltransferase|nr:MAG: 1-acyl-sn-glycerol-3-phosphate acyltransferase [candidate division BRC1 bacterium HGW-BRC1-1]
MRPFYRLVHFTFGLLCKLLFRAEAVTPENLPITGGLLVCSNHASNLDPPLIAVQVPRELHFMAKAELFSNPLFGRIIRALNAHPVKRDGVDRKTLREYLDVLKGGGALIIFPEGTRTTDGNLQTSKTGAAMIAAQAGVPVMPIYVDGSFEAMPRGKSWPRRTKVRVYYGKPFDTAEILAAGDRKDRYERLAAEIMRRIAELRDDAIARRSAV